MEKYLIAIDLDGTLLPNLYGLSDFNVMAFNKIREAGHKIIITTGRPFRSSFFVYRKLGLDTPLINYNGQLITNPRDYRYKSFSKTIKKDEVLDIYNHEEGKYSVFFCEEEDNIYSNIDDEYVHPLMHHSFMSSLYVGDLNKILKKDIHGALILAKDGYGKEIEEYVNKHHKNIGARLWAWGPYKEIVELYLKEYNKGTAIKMVREELGFDKDHTIICGDSINDFEFFQEGTIRITPSNGDDRIKELSTVVLDKECKDDAIAHYLLEFLNIGEDNGN